MGRVFLTVLLLTTLVKGRGEAGDSICYDAQLEGFRQRRGSGTSHWKQLEAGSVAVGRRPVNSRRRGVRLLGSNRTDLSLCLPRLKAKR